jgi:hypothetical protein
MTPECFDRPRIYSTKFGGDCVAAEAPLEAFLRGSYFNPESDLKSRAS